MIRLPTPEFVWRAASPEDEPFILDLTAATMLPYFRMAPEWEECSYRNWMRDRNAGLCWLIAVVEGEDVGAMAVRRTPQHIHVDSLHVRSDDQRRGIGTAMVDDICAQADALLLPVRLEVLKHNAGAVRLYQRRGFRVTGEHSNYLIMVRKAPRKPNGSGPYLAVPSTL
jgi:ribosomal protein S18 acetylase RimI-like enzyme